MRKIKNAAVLTTALALGGCCSLYYELFAIFASTIGIFTNVGVQVYSTQTNAAGLAITDVPANVPVDDFCYAVASGGTIVDNGFSNPMNWYAIGRCGWFKQDLNLANPLASGKTNPFYRQQYWITDGDFNRGVAMDHLNDWIYAYTNGLLRNTNRLSCVLDATSDQLFGNGYDLNNDGRVDYFESNLISIPNRATITQNQASQALDGAFASCP